MKSEPYCRIMTIWFKELRREFRKARLKAEVPIEPKKFVSFYNSGIDPVNVVIDYKKANLRDFDEFEEAKRKVMKN